MSVSLAMIHRCDVHRYTETAEGYGERRVPAIHLAGVHCRLMTDMQRAFNSLTAQWLIFTRFRMIVPFSTDVIAGDRITEVIDEYGEPIAGNWEVRGALHRRGLVSKHLLLELEKVS